MRWERALTTGESLVLSGQQVFLFTPSPRGALAREVSWWSNEQVVLHLQAFSTPGFGHVEARQLRDRLQARVVLPWATLELHAPGCILTAERAIHELVEAGPAKWSTSRFSVANGDRDDQMAVLRDGVHVGGVRDTQYGIQVCISTDHQDVGLVIFSATLRACRESSCREARLLLRMFNGVEHDCIPSRDVFAVRHQLEMLGNPLPLPAELAWFPIHRLAINGDLRSTSEDAIVIDF
jgi:hypothetical protein